MINKEYPKRIVDPRYEIKNPACRYDISPLFAVLINPGNKSILNRRKKYDILKANNFLRENFNFREKINNQIIPTYNSLIRSPAKPAIEKEIITKKGLNSKNRYKTDFFLNLIILFFASKRL